MRRYVALATKGMCEDCGTERPRRFSVLPRDVPFPLPRQRPEPMSFLHRHVWKVVSKEHQPSPLVQLAQHHVSASKIWGEQWMRESWLVTYHCETCGSEKVEVVSL